MVEEVLANPDARQRIAEEADADRRALIAQGIASNFLVCRQVHSAYQDWIEAGVPPKNFVVPPLEDPFVEIARDWQVDIDNLNAAVASREPSRLREFISGEGSCGEWIPAEPDDVSGVTIEEALVGTE